MSKIREIVITNCEKSFLLKCLSDFRRLDGRAFSEFRPLRIRFGKDWGCCCVSLGKTRVLAQTSCEIQPPKSSRPSEGTLNVNVELSPLAAPHFEPGRQSEFAVQLNRLLEKCIKDSKAVDLESLCVKTGERVWALRVDVNVLNHEGNILDAASVAALAALAHFRRPDVTCDGEEFIVHSFERKDPIPTVIHHYPVCVTFAVFGGGEYILADPSLLEEGTADANLVISLNGFKELCGLHLGGKAELMTAAILGTVTKAVSRATTVIEEIKSAVKADNEKRERREIIGFHVDDADFECDTVVELEKCLDHWNDGKKKNKKNKKRKDGGCEARSEIRAEKVEVVGIGSAEFVPEEGWESSNSEDDLIIVEKVTECVKVANSDSEEDDVVILN